MGSNYMTYFLLLSTRVNNIKPLMFFSAKSFFSSILWKKLKYLTITYEGALTRNKLSSYTHGKNFLTQI